jgi:hypothetical protein
MFLFWVKVSPGWPVSRILSSERIPVYTRGLRPGPRAWAVISLCSLPGTSNEAGRLSSLLGLAPGGGCLAACIAAGAGGLLHRLFTLALTGSLFLWPDPADCSAPGFPRRRALWSADFPRSRASARNRDRPASLKTSVSYRLSGGESTGAPIEEFHHPQNVTKAPPGNLQNMP